MGQKCSCFGKLRFGRRLNTTAGLERMTYIKNPIPAKPPRISRYTKPDSETVMLPKDYLHLDFPKESKWPESSGKEEIPKACSSEFHVRKKILISDPSVSDLGIVRSSSPSNPSSKELMEKGTFPEQDIDTTYYHSLPYIPIVTNLTFLDDGIEKKDLQQSGISSSSSETEGKNLMCDSFPSIPPEPKLMFIDGGIKNEDLQQSVIASSPSETQDENLMYDSSPLIPKEPTLTFIDGDIENEDLQKSSISSSSSKSERESLTYDSFPFMPPESKPAFIDGEIENEDLPKSSIIFSPREVERENEVVLEDANVHSRKIDSKDRKTLPDIPPRSFESISVQI